MLNVIDSVGWIEYFTDGPLADRYSKYIEDQSSIVTPSVVLYEVFKKILRDGSERAAVDAIAHIQQTNVVPLTAELAIVAAEISLEHRLAMADAIVYASARSAGATLVTSDFHFKDLCGVEYIPKKK